MRDIDIRRELKLSELAKFQDDPSSRVVEELGLCQGIARVDVAVVNGAMHGYEIKSERDTLDRLPSQAQIYNKVFDEVTLVVAESHLEKAAAIIPDWWGILCAKPIHGAVCLEWYRMGARNTDVDPFAVAQLLWREEALAILDEIGESRGYKSKPRLAIWKKLAECLSLDDLTKVVREALKIRAVWRVDPEPLQYDGSSLPSAKL